MRSVKLWFLLAGFLIALGDLEVSAAFFVFASTVIPIIEELGVVPGYVYVLKSGKNYKIGVTSRDVEGRIKQLQTGSASKISLIHKIPSWRPYKIESKLHQQFANKHIRGEWFNLSPYDIRKLKSL